MATNQKPYKIKEEHEEVIKVDPTQADLTADEYHKVPGGVIVPQTRPYGGIEYDGDQKQEILIQEVEMPEDGDIVTKKVGVLHKDNNSETPSESIAPSELVASVSQSPEGSPPKPRKLLKVIFDSKVFGKVTLPVMEILNGEECIALVTDSSDGFTFIPPVLGEPFDMQLPGVTPATSVYYCGQTFQRPTRKEQYLILVPADKKS